MSRSSKYHTTQPSLSYVRRYSLDELFSDEELVDKLGVARNRIAATFTNATEWRHGRKRGTHNYILGVGGQQKDLEDHIIKHTLTHERKGIVTASELPKSIGDHIPTLKAVVRETNIRLIAAELDRMVNGEKLIWYNEHHGTWEALQSVIDNYLAELTNAKQVRKVDERLRREALHGGGRLRVVH